MTQYKHLAKIKTNRGTALFCCKSFHTSEETWTKINGQRAKVSDKKRKWTKIKPRTECTVSGDEIK